LGVRGVDYWQPQVPAPVTSERRVACDGLPEPELELEPELEELVCCVAEAGGVDLAAELLWVSGATARLVDVSRAGVYFVTTTR
jgi:hypothetical protein